MFKGIKRCGRSCAYRLSTVVASTKANKEAILYRTVHYYFRKEMKNLYMELRKSDDFEEIRKELSAELLRDKIINKEIPQELFNKVLRDLKEEMVYLYEILPMIINNKDTDLREKFLKESNLDRYYVEELEREFIELKGIDPSIRRPDAQV